MSSRPRRNITKSSAEASSTPSRKWKEKEIETLWKCIMEYGHKNLEKIQEHLPGRSIENIKTFMRTVHDTAGKTADGNPTLDGWIELCNTPAGTPWRDCVQVAQILKYLSVDGLLENHPLPERCQGIDFRLAYRLLYQAMMGYPIQPVNKETADFVIQNLAELNGEIQKQTATIKNLELYLQNKLKNEEPNPAQNNSKTSSVSNEPKKALEVKKPLKVYQRKKPSVGNSETVPSLKITIQESSGDNSLGSGYSKDYSVTVEGTNSSQSTTVNVPVPCQVTINEDEQELLKSSSYNPFQLPEKWLEEPLYLNLMQKL